MLKFLKDVFTGSDNETYEIAHILWALGVICFLGMAIYYVWTAKAYPGNFGTDFMALNAGGAVGSVARAKSDQMNK